MQVRGLLIAVIALGLLGAGAWWSDRQKTAEEATSGTEATKLVQVKEEDVRKIEIRRRDAAAPVVIERDKSNNWQMTSPETWRVEQEAATGIASTYAGLSYDRVVDEKASDLAGYGLATPAVEVSVTAKDGKTRKLLFGDDTPTGGNVYAKLDNDPRVFTLSSFNKTGLDKTAMDLRDKRLLVFDSEKLTRVELASKSGPIEFGRNAQKEWQIVRPRPQRADNGQVEELVRKLGDARMDSSMSAEDLAKNPVRFVSAARVGTATLTDASGTHTLEVRKSGEDYLAKGSALEGVFKIPNDAGEALNKSLDDFRNKKIFDFGFSAPSKVTLRVDAKTYEFQKSGENWTSGGKQMDPTSVQNMIDKLRDLSSIKFVETGFTTPTIDISVTSDEGKRVEKVQISKTGNSYFAKREGDTILYELDGRAVEELQRAAGDVKEPPPPPKQ